MASDLLTIASSGARAARAALDVTAQNIANVDTPGYVRRSVRLAEIAPPSAPGQIGDASLSGVRIDRIVRNSDAFRVGEVRRTTSDVSRANAELSGLENIEASLENARIYPAIVDFEGSLEELAIDPANLSLRASVLETARTTARSFNVAAGALDAVGESARFEATAAVDEVNLFAQELARINLRLARAQDGSTDQSSLLDKRDLMLQQLSERADVTVTVNQNLTVEVHLGSGGTDPLVSGGNTTPLTMATASDGTLSFAVNGSPVTLSGGSLAGHSQALVHVRETRADLDAAANRFVTLINTAQAAGTNLGGTTGQPLLSGATAASIAVIATDPAAIATAPANAPAGSRDPANLVALRGALAVNGPAKDMNSLLFEVSSQVSGLTTTRDALEAISASASIALKSQAGVDLDNEAVNLIRFQQAFQASGRAMQVATELFDTILGVG